MPNPLPGALHIDQALTDYSVSYGQDLSTFIARELFPVVRSPVKSNEYYIWDKGDAYRDEVKQRAAGSAAALTALRLSNTPFNCLRYALGFPISDPQRANADPAVAQLERTATRHLTNALARNQDVRWAAANFVTGTWDGDQTGVAAAPGANQFLQWDVPAADPIATFERLIDEQELKTGYRPNRLLLGVKAWRDIKQNAQVIDRLKGAVNPGTVKLGMLATELELDKVMVARAILNTAVEGATPVMARAFDEVASLLMYTEEGVTLESRTAGKTFVWDEFDTGALHGAAIKVYREERIESDIVEAMQSDDMQVIDTELGLFLDQSTGA